VRFPDGVFLGIFAVLCAIGLVPLVPWARLRPGARLTLPTAKNAPSHLSPAGTGAASDSSSLPSAPHDTP
jgi:hypothetical protein